VSGKVAPALPAYFPTPDTPSEDTVCRVFRVPNDDQYLGALMAAAFALTDSWRWYPYGTLTPDEAAQVWLEIINQAYVESLNPVCPTDTVQAPFWDDTDGADADDIAPADEQGWYGQWDGESFTETLAYVLLTNFLSTLTTPQAAIKFLTVPRAFRVAIRANPHGAKLLAFMDGGLYAVINGYSIVEQVVETIIVSPGSELMLVVSDEHDPAATPDADGNYPVSVIRSRLTEETVIPPDVRYDTTGDEPVFQTTGDDGGTWSDAPDADPRYNTGYMLPPITYYSGLECDVAARMTAQLQDTLNNFIASVDAAQWVTGLLALAVFPLGIAGWLLDVALFVANALTDIGQANIEAAFTSDVYDDIRCAFHCRIDENGRITQAALDDAYDEIKALHAGVVAGTIDELRFFFTDVPMTNAGVLRDETGDCSDCDPCTWRWRWIGNDLRDDWTPFSFRPCYGTGYLAATAYYDPSLSTGSWHAPVGSGAFRSVLALARNVVIPAGSTLTKITAHVTQGGTHVDSNLLGAGNAAQPLDCTGATSQHINPTTFGNWILTLSPTFTGDVFATVSVNENASNGQSWIDAIYMEGTGKCPFGDASNY
jgi:hypothetical protein